MSGSPERSAYEENFAFQDSFKNSLRSKVGVLASLRVLDYGAGVIPYPFSDFAGLNPKQEIVAYDPNALISLQTQRDLLEANQRWTNVEPKGEEFDLVICHFSLHHMDESPEDVIRRLRNFKPRLIGLLEYDYKGIDLQEFRQTFVNDAERRELLVSFKGDVDTCHAFHSRVGLDEYERVLIANSYRIIARSRGYGAAQYKFFLIGEPQS